MNEPTPEQKKALRKARLGSKAADEARYAIQRGINEPGLSGAYIQFGADLQNYGLWEALLYAESYEKQGQYVKGTVQKALNAALKHIKVQ